jgi:hypothetical protein
LGHFTHSELFPGIDFELDGNVKLLDVSISQCYDLNKSGNDYLNDLAEAFTMAASRNATGNMVLMEFYLAGTHHPFCLILATKKTALLKREPRTNLDAGLSFRFSKISLNGSERLCSLNK